MKYIYLFISLVFIGCSSTYTLKNFSSQNEFFKNFNNFADDRESNVYMNTQNYLTALEGTKIKNDTLYIVLNYKKEHTVMPLNEIKNINYRNYSNNNENHEGYIILKNEEVIRAVDIKTKQDSVQFTKLKSILKCVPITDVDKIVFKRTGVGVFPGILIGASTGFLIGMVTYPSVQSNSTPRYVSLYYIIGAPAAGGVIGGILGWLKGECIYLF